MEEVASKFVDASDLAPNSKNVLKESVVLHAHASGASDLYKRGKLTPQAWADLMERVVASAEKLKDPGPDAVDFMNETRASITHIRSGGGAVIHKEGFDQVTLDLVSYVTSRRMVETMPAEEHDYANALIEELNKHLVACRQAFLTYAFRRN
jgi:hypothetical protein